jgi:hypothetical protein
MNYAQNGKEIRMIDYILDTNILILFFAGKLKQPLPTAKLGISVISEIEILSYAGLTAHEEKQLKNMLKNFSRLSLTDEIKQQTIIIKKSRKIKLPDAIICATAMTEQAILLTNDKQLHSLPYLTTQSLEAK